MNRPIDDDGEYYDRRSDPNRADREISLGAPTILGSFFGIALLCAAFFGFGYSMGHAAARNAQAAAIAANTDFNPGTGTAKPSAGSASIPPEQPISAVPNSTPVQQQTAVVSVAPASSGSNVAPSDRIIVGDKLPVAQHATAIPQATAASFLVQVAAVSTQDLADIEVAALKKDGYTVAVRHEPQDKLLHVQIGPFPDRKSAEAMQKRVIADGFNAIVK